MVCQFVFVFFFVKGGGEYEVAPGSYVFSLEKSTEKSIRNKFSFFLFVSFAYSVSLPVVERYI